MKGAIAKAEEIQRSDPGITFLLQQFENPPIRRSTSRPTGPEIWTTRAGQIDVLVSGIGTGGTNHGGLAVHQAGFVERPLISVGVEPEAQPHPHADAQGRAAEARPAQDPGDRRRLHPRHAGPQRGGPHRDGEQRRSHRVRPPPGQGEGILSGISCGAAGGRMPVRLARLPEFKGKTIVAILPRFRRAVSELRAVRGAIV